MPHRSIDKDRVKAQAKNRSKRWTILAAITVASGLSVAYFGTGGFSVPPARASETTEPAPRVAVMAQKANFVQTSRTSSYVATLRPRIETQQSFQVVGRVQERLVETGQQVKRGQELGRLDQSDFQLALMQSKAEESAATEVQQTAEEDERRAKSLHASGTVSKAVLDSANSRAQEARARLDRARAQVELAQNALDYTTLRAAADGVIVQQMLNPGEVVVAGQPVMLIAFSGALEAEVALPESLPLPGPGWQARFRPWSQPDASFPAQLREISPAADVTTHTFNTRFTLDDSAGLSSGMTGKLELVSPGDRLVRLPVSAVYDAGDGQGPGLWRIGPSNRLAFVPVETTGLEGQDVLIRADLSPTDVIVTMGANRLKADQPVTVIEQSVE